MKKTVKNQAVKTENIKEIGAEIRATVRKMTNKTSYMRLREYNTKLTALLKKHEKLSTVTKVVA